MSFSGSPYITLLDASVDCLRFATGDGEWALVTAGAERSSAFLDSTSGEIFDLLNDRHGDAARRLDDAAPAERQVLLVRR